MAKIDTDELRDYLEDYCGTAASSGFPAALLDVADIENMDGYERIVPHRLLRVCGGESAESFLCARRSWAYGVRPSLAGIPDT